MVGVGVESCTVVFLGRHFRHFCCIGYIVQLEYTAKNRNAEISASGIAMGSAIT